MNKYKKLFKIPADKYNVSFMGKDNRHSRIILQGQEYRLVVDLVSGYYQMSQKKEFDYSKLFFYLKWQFLLKKQFVAVYTNSKLLQWLKRVGTGANAFENTAAHVLIVTENIVIECMAIDYTWIDITIER